MTGQPAAADGRAQILQFEDLKGWRADDHAAALAVFRETCPDVDRPDWGPLCALAGDVADARGFFELFFRPVLISDGNPALFTGYYEPELDGARSPGGRFRYPIFRRPPEVTAGEPWLTRAEIEEQGILLGRGLEIVWLDDPVDVFFLQVQGSGRIRLRDGSALRVGYVSHPGRSHRPSPLCALHGKIVAG